MVYGGLYERLRYFPQAALPTLALERMRATSSEEGASEAKARAAAAAEKVAADEAAWTEAFEAEAAPAPAPRAQMSFQDHVDLATAPEAAALELPDGFGRTVMPELKVLKRKIKKGKAPPRLAGAAAAAAAFGAAVETEPIELVCPGCTRINPSARARCSGCRHPLEDAEIA